MSGRKKWSKASIATCGLRRGAGIRARATLERIGKLLANMDLLIAAHAAAVGAVLVTNDHTLEACSKHIDVRQTVNWADDVGVKP